MIIQTSSPQKLIALDKEKKSGIVLIWFYATWCGHCNDMEGDWNKLSNNHPKGINLAKVESEDMSNYNKSPGEEELRGFPTLRLYDKGNMIQEYQGNRDYNSIYNFVNSYLKKHKKSTKNNLAIVKARSGNVINKRLVQKIINNRKKTKKAFKKKTVKDKKKNSNVSLRKKKRKSHRKKRKTVKKKTIN
jgi:thioredoxin-like negative regulator of GroEL